MWLHWESHIRFEQSASAVLSTVFTGRVHLSMASLGPPRSVRTVRRSAGQARFGGLVARWIRLPGPRDGRSETRCGRRHRWSCPTGRCVTNRRRCEPLWRAAGAVAVPMSEDSARARAVSPPGTKPCGMWFGTHAHVSHCRLSPYCTVRTADTPLIASQCRRILRHALQSICESVPDRTLPLPCLHALPLSPPPKTPDSAP